MDEKKGESPEEVEHGIDSAFYGLKAIGRYGEHRPQLACLCGFVTDNYENEWAEAGAALDEHLAASAPSETNGGKR